MNFTDKIQIIKRKLLVYLLEGDSSEYFSVASQDILSESIEAILEENTGCEWQYWKLYAFERTIKRIYDDFKADVNSIQCFKESKHSPRE